MRNFLLFSLLFSFIVSNPIHPSCREAISYGDRFSYYPYQEKTSGLYGVRYQDEIVILPQFAELKGYNSIALFAYRSDIDNKWGLVSTYDIITTPEFDEINIVKQGYNRYWAIVLKDGKYGLMNPRGEYILPIEYDSIGKPDSWHKLNYSWQKEKIWPTLIPAKKNGKWNIVNIKNHTLAFDIPAKYANLSDCSLKELKKLVGKQLSELVKQAKKDKNAECLLEKKGDLSNDIFGKAPNPNPNIPYKEIILYDKSGTVNELGVIFIPHNFFEIGKCYCNYNPYNVYKLWDDLDHLKLDEYETEYERLQAQQRRNIQYHKGLLEIAEICKLTDLEESDFYKSLTAEINRRNNISLTLDNKISEERDRLEANARIDAFAKSMTSILTSAMNIVSSVSNNNDITSTISSEFSSLESGSTIDKTKSSSDFSLSEQTSYNSDKRVYSQYDSMLSQYFAGNRNASESEKKQWQSKMKSLRQKWEKKGKSFPRSENESR